MIKRLKYDWKMIKLNSRLNRAADALLAGQVMAAKPLIVEAFKIIQSIRLPKTALINVITGFGMMGLRLEELGAGEMAEECRWASDLLRKRLDAGDYYADS